VNGGQSLVSGINTDIPDFLQPGQESSNLTRGDISEGKVLRSNSLLLLEIKEKLFKSIPVRLDGMGADIPLSG